MKKLLHLLGFTIFILLNPTFIVAQSTNAAYDSTSAKKLNADDYGMKKYVMVFLKTGSETPLDNPKTDSLFTAYEKHEPAGR